VLAAADRPVAQAARFGCGAKPASEQATLPAGSGAGDGIIAVFAGAAGPPSRHQMNLKTIALVTVWLATGLPAHAQTVVQLKPAPSAEAKTKSLGTGRGGGPILTRDELRACMNQQASIRTRLADIDAQREQLDKDKQAIAADQDSIRAEHAAIKAFQQEVADFNARMKAFNAKPPEGDEGEKLRQQLKAEQEELKNEEQALQAKKTELKSNDQAGRVKAFNDKATALGARIDDWNERNKAWNERAKAIDDERSGWVTACADRRYREDDEIAIKNGK
jgi:hypothetical protein